MQEMKMCGNCLYATSGLGGDPCNPCKAFSNWEPQAGKASTAKDPYLNPKDALGATKAPLSLFPASALAVGSTALLNGALKYGKANWRTAGVRSSIYTDAALRHLYAWIDGEEADPDDGVDNLGAVLACVAILVDARALGRLHDDRPLPGRARDSFEDAKGIVQALKELHKDQHPIHQFNSTYKVNP